MLMPAAKASAHGNSVGFVNVCIATSIFAGSLAGFIHRRWKVLRLGPVVLLEPSALSEKTFVTAPPM